MKGSIYTYKYINVYSGMNGVRYVYCKIDYDVNLLLQMKSDFNY